MKRIFVAGLFLASFALVATTALAQCGTIGGECLLSGKLDDSVAGSAGDPGSNPNWTLTNTGNATAAQYQGGFANSQDTDGLGVWYRSFLGNATAGPVSSTLSQDVVVPSAGDYQLTFDAVIEQNVVADSIVATLSSSSGPSVSLDLLSKKIGAGSSYTGGGFGTIAAATPPYDIVQKLSLSGVQAGDTLTVSVAMTNGMSAGMNPQSTVVDNFSLARVPEPASVLLAGISLIGLMGLRRR